MTHKNHLQEFARYCTQNVLGMIGLSCYILADTFFVANGIGSNGLAALNLAIPIYSFIHGCGLMIGIGGGTRFSIFKGQKADKRSNQLFTTALSMGAIIAIVCVLCGLFFSGVITSVLGADVEVFAMTNTYIKVILLFSPAFLMNEILLCFVRNDGNPKLSMTAMLGGSLFNIIFDYIFIFPMKMGIFGAVLATGVAPIVSMLLLSLHFIKKQNTFHLSKDKPSLSMGISMVSLGFPSLVTEVSAGVVMIVFNIMILNLAGNTGVAAYGVVANLSLVVVAIFTGIAQGMQPLLGRSYGKGEHYGLKKIFGYGVKTVAVFAVVIYLLFFFFADPITGIFNSEGDMQLQTIASTGLKLYFLSIPFVGFNVVLSMYFTCTEKALQAQIISLLRGLILIIPMAFLLASLFNLTGIWLAMPVTELLVTVLGIWLFWHVRRLQYTS